MHGQNPVTKPQYRDDGSLYVKEIFYTIQGEGPFAGQPAVFVRLAGCNLRCHFCDTDFSGGSLMTPQEILQAVYTRAPTSRCDLVVISGGEPLAQQIGPVVEKLSYALYRVQIETAGTCWPEPDLILMHLIQTADLGSDNVTIVCSPKTPQLNSTVVSNCWHYKYIIRADEQDPEDLLPAFSTQRQGERAHLYRPADRNSIIYVQPCDEGILNKERTARNTQACVEAALRKGYRLSLQQHKILNLP